MRSESDGKRNPSKTESYPMDQWLGLSSDRYGHQVTAGGGASSKTRSLEVSHSAEPDELGEPLAHDLIFQNAAARSPIRRFLIPIDALEVKPADLKPILKVAERFDAEVTLLHCYKIPPSFDYAVGPSAPMEVTLHRDMAKTRLLKLCTEVRKFFAKCRYEFAVGSLAVEILRAIDTLDADLVVVSLPLDFISYGWTTKELMDELVRKANCAVLWIPSAQNEVDRFNVASRGFNMNILETERSSDKLVSIKKVVVAVDLTKHSEATAHYAAQIARWFDASLYIAHVFSRPPSSEFGSEGAYNVIDQERGELRARLDQLTEQVHQLVPVCESVNLEGESAEQISALARDLGADLIITASHHPTFLARLFNLDKAPKIMHQAPCPVLVYHQENT
jgi:nucleotide-binding universal stress UspA family protein